MARATFVSPMGPPSIVVSGAVVSGGGVAVGVAVAVAVAVGAGIAVATGAGAGAVISGDAGSAG